MVAVRVTIRPSQNPQKKYDAVLEEPGIRAKKVSFGQAGAEDFTMHKDEERKRRYLARHRGEQWDNPLTAGFWSVRLLWNKPTLVASARDIQRQFPHLRVVIE